MSLVQTVHLQMSNYKSPPVIPAVQNDTDRQVKMVLDDYALSAGLDGKITFIRSDGTHYEASATLDVATNSFTADIDQALTQPGRTMVQLKVTDTLTVSTFSFVIYVEEDTSGTVTPQEGIDLVTAVEAAEDAADRAESAAETLELDATLTSPTKAAQAKAVGDALTVKGDLVEGLQNALSLSVDNTNAGYETILFESWELGGYNPNDGQYPTNDKIRIKNPILIEKGKTYVFRYSGTAFDVIRYANASYMSGVGLAWGGTEDVTVTPAHNYYVGIALRTNNLNVAKPCMAVKNVIALVKDAIGNPSTSPTMIQGGTSSSDGTLIERTNRICTELNYRLEDFISASIGDGFQFIVAQYDDSGFIGNYGSGWVQTVDKASLSGTNFRITVRKTDDADFLPNADTGLIINLVAQNTTGLLLKSYKETNRWKQGDKNLQAQIESIKSVIGTDVIGVNQIARLGWKPYAAYYPPEQSLASYKLAYEMGVRLLLADLRKTSDGKFVCVHDESINSIARNSDGSAISSTVNVADHTLAELNAYDYGIYKGYPNEGILTLDNFLKLCSQINCVPVIETKIWVLTEEIESICLMVRKYGLQNGFVWAEMPETTIANRTCTIVRAMLPNATIMIRGGSYSADAINSAITFSDADKKTILSFTDFTSITSETVETCRENNIDIEYSMVDSESDMDDFFAETNFSDVRYWVSSEFNVHDYLMRKIM